jgi:hypothetical protein
MPAHCIVADMPGIFINYRRDDAPGAAGRLHDYLARSFSRRDLLIDVDAIEPGFDFDKQIETQVSQCDALLALIGPHWLMAKDEQGRRRLHNETDYVRIEIASALQRGIPVIPVLLDSTPMPSESELPHDLKGLAKRQGLELRHTRFAADADAIVSALKHCLPRTRKRWMWPLAAACLIGCVSLGLAFYVWLRPTSPRASLVPPVVSTGPTPELSSLSCDQEKNLRSPATTTASTEIAFTNRVAEKRRIYWLNFNGIRVFYASLEPGQTVSYQTYIGHPWLVANDADECKAIYLPAADQHEVDVY